MKKAILLTLLISSNCLTYWPIANVPCYRQVEMRDCREEMLMREVEEARRRNDRDARAQVIVVQPQQRDYREPRFEWITNSDKNLIKYGLFGVIMCLLILRRG